MMTGKPVVAADLPAALQAEQAVATAPLIEIQVSPQAGVHALQHAVQAARAAPARVAFVDDALSN